MPWGQSWVGGPALGEQLVGCGVTPNASHGKRVCVCVGAETESERDGEREMERETERD